MNRGLAILIGLSLLLAGGIAHGLWTGRWQPSGELGRSPSAAPSLSSRTFTDPATGEQVLVMLLAGKPTRMAVHKPEDCYRAAGYELAGQPIKIPVTPAGQPGADLWTDCSPATTPAKEPRG
jgi:hypothetical protein